MQGNGTDAGTIVSGYEIDPARPGMRGGMMPPSQRMCVRFDNGVESYVRVKNPSCDLRSMVGQRVAFSGLATSSSGHVSATGITTAGAAPAAQPQRQGWTPQQVAPWRPPAAPPAPVRQPPFYPPAAPLPPLQLTPANSVTFGHLVRDYAVCVRIAREITTAASLRAEDIVPMAATLYIQAEKAKLRANITKGEVRLALAALDGKGNVPGVAVGVPEEPPPFEPPPAQEEDIPF